MVAFGRADLDKDDGVLVQGDEVELPEGAGVIAGDDAIAETLKKTQGGPFGARAEPAPPPRFAGQGFHS